MRNDKCKTKMKRYDMDIEERVHRLYLMCGANLSSEELRIAMREIDSEAPTEMYKKAKASLKKNFGSTALLSTKRGASCKPIKIEQDQYNDIFYVKPEEYEAYMSWKSKGRRNNLAYSGNQTRASNTYISSHVNNHDVYDCQLSCFGSQDRVDT